MIINRVIAFILYVILFLAFAFWLGSCSPGKYCDPNKIRSGESERHHDTKKFRGMIRVKWMHQFGNYCLVKFENMKESFSKVYYGSDCSKYKTGMWVSVDSI